MQKYNCPFSAFGNIYHLPDGFHTKTAFCKAMDKSRGTPFCHAAFGQAD